MAVERLAEEGHEVVYVTKYDRIVTNSGYNNRLDYQDMFRRSPRIRTRTFTDLASFEGGKARLIDPDGIEVEVVSVDVVVAGVHPVPRDGLVVEFEDAGHRIRTCGDVIAPRGVTTAIREATLLAMAL